MEGDGGLKAVGADPNGIFKKAEALRGEGRLDEAAAQYGLLLNDSMFGPVCMYRLAQVANEQGNAQEAYDLYNRAFAAQPAICKIIFPEGHPHRDYVFGGMKQELEYGTCPLCGEAGKPHWCYPMPETANYTPEFNPVRLWLRCESCNHLFSKYYPERLFLYNDEPRKAQPAFFAGYSDILSNIRRYTQGTALFEVGVGACECTLVAREMGYDVFGIDVIARHVQDARELYGLNVETHDFGEFETDKTWDVMIMGDVLEHVTDPVAAIEKANRMLNRGGVLWVSTPNFESAFSAFAGHNDPMRRQTFHLNYFSRDSLYGLLRRFGFEPMDYRVSPHYNGSMEIIAVKQ